MSYLDGLQPAQQRAALRGLSSADQTRVTSAIRRGEGNDSTRMAVSLNRLNGTSWGRAHTSTLQHLEAMHDRHELSFSSSVNGFGVTEGGRITLHSELRNQPEALSAFMAHEGTHAQQSPSMHLMDAELAAHVAQSEVWREVRGPQTQTEATRQLDGHLSSLNQSRDHLAYHIAATYFASDTTSLADRGAISRYALSHPGISALMPEN